MKGLVYVLQSHQTEEKYYGSTTQRLLCQRLAGHKNDYRRMLSNKCKRNSSSFNIVKYDDVYIELVEEVEYNNIHELRAREQYYIKNNICVNKKIPNRSPKEWRDDNKEHYLQHKREYVKNRREQTRLSQKKWRENNKP